MKHSSLHFTLDQIQADVQGRAAILKQLKRSFDPYLCQKTLTYSTQVDHKSKTEFLRLMGLYLRSQRIESSPYLKGHLGFLYKVYTGQDLNLNECREGSKFHRVCCQTILGQVRLEDFFEAVDPQWPILLKQLQADYIDLPHQVIRNIMIDESLERLGRDLSPKRQSRYA